ncbi:hypothetical protein ACA910_007801 [Epithemia clementina (nom. ined.)]
MSQGEEARPPTATMMEEEQPKADTSAATNPKPYEWPDDGTPSTEVLTLWNEVGNGLDKSQTVVWKSAVESLESAHHNFRTSPDARAFVEKYMAQIVGILVDQIPSKIGNYEKECVQDSLALAIQIVAQDLEIQIERRGVCLVLKALEHIFHKKKNYYKMKGNNNPSAWHHHQGAGMNQGLPEVRIRMIHKFRQCNGFKFLSQYMRQTIGTSHFVDIEPLRQILGATADLVPRQQQQQNNNNTGTNASIAGNSKPDSLKKETEDDAIEIGDAVMSFITHMADDDLKKIPVEQLSYLQQDLQLIFDRLVISRRQATYEFYDFWRRLAYKLLSSSSLPLKLFGWETVNELIDASEKHRPPPRYFWVKGAGCTFANGLYEFAGPVTPDGYHRPSSEISYVRQIPANEPQGGHKLTLFRCTMRSQQKWWFLSEADEEQPGTDRDIDYYQHKSLKDQEEAYPPASGWATCRTSGIDPPPTTQAIGWMVPLGEERNTLEHQLAMWAIEQKIVEQVLGDTTSHREVVARSTALIKFLAQMCTREDNVLAEIPPQLLQQQVTVGAVPSSSSGDDSSSKENRDVPAESAVASEPGSVLPTVEEKANIVATAESRPATTAAAPDKNRYCLQASHLLFAWKTCTRKADAAVSAQVYQLLVSILPLCPPNLAIPLLQAVQKSLGDPQHNSEVVLFCSALSEGNLIEPPNNNNVNSKAVLDDQVRLEILNLMWAVLTHPEASNSKSSDSIRRYVNFELRGERGAEHRERFLLFCLAALEKSATVQAEQVDENQALLMVRLTHFVVEACPRAQAYALATQNNCAFPELLFNELKAYLLRRRKHGLAGIGGSSSSIATSRGFRKMSTSSTPSLVVNGTGGDSSLIHQLHKNAFQDRLRILRLVYGLSDHRTTTTGSAAGAVVTDPILMTAEMIKTLWSLCDSPIDRESMIMFIAGASHNGKIASDGQAASPHPQQPDQSIILTPAFTEDVCRQIFLDLFCAEDFDFGNLGAGGYKSFHFLFLSVRRSLVSSPADRRAALDVQWKVCLRANANDVAQQAMRDLLAVYISASNSKVLSAAVPGSLGAVGQEVTSIDGPLDDDFGERIFHCLSKVKEDIQNSVEAAELAAERCIRILNAAVSQQIDNIGSYSNTPSTLTRLSNLPATATLEEVQNCLPHGLRGQSACFHVAITARRNPMQNSISQNMLPNTNTNAAGTPPGQPRSTPSTSRFTLDLHPLETLHSVKRKVAVQCNCPLTSVKPLHITGRRTFGNSESGNFSLSSVPEDSVMDELGVVYGCEMVVSISDRMQSSLAMAVSNRSASTTSDLSAVFFNDESKFSDQLFTVLLELLDLLLDPPRAEGKMDVDGAVNVASSTRHLIWDLLQSMPTNSSIISSVRSATAKMDAPSGVEDAMEIDSTAENNWSQLIDISSLNRVVYVLLTIDALLNPAPAALSVLPPGQLVVLETQLADDAAAFRHHFVESGGFAAVVRFFSQEDDNVIAPAFDLRRGNAVALRILKTCLFADAVSSDGDGFEVGAAGSSLVQSLSNTKGLLKSLTSMVVDDSGVPSSTVMDVIRMLRLLFSTPDSVQSFMNLPRDLAKRLITSLLVRDETDAGLGRYNSSIKSSMQVRTAMSTMIIQTPLLADGCLPWLIEAVERVEVKSETTFELFHILEKLVAETSATARSRPTSNAELGHLALIVCQTLSACPRPSSESELVDLTTGVLCGCLKLLRALVGTSSGSLLRPGTDLLINSLSVGRWSNEFKDSSPDDLAMLDLMGAVFDGLLTPSKNSSVAICCDRESRREGFDVVASIARNCSDGKGYLALVFRLSKLLGSCAPSVRHRWGEHGGVQDSHSRVGRASKYSGLRNQGCTCYMNSALQQLFMMPELRNSICSAPLPTALRSSGSITSKGADLVGKKISLQWETGVSFDATVERFDACTGMHVIRYNPIQVATVNAGHQQVRPEDIDRLPPPLPDEFILADGRPGKETGIFDIVNEASVQVQTDEQKTGGEEPMQVGEIKESEDEASSRRLLEEVQRTFIYLAEGSKGRCFDPRALVEACACLKLEFDVWQQNDASEFVTKLLDRLEISLKKWAPDSFKYLDHTFGLKQTRQKICKECGLKTNKEEKLINIDCQIRGKTDIHEALAAMTEADVMEGSNKVSCDRCRKKTDTILRTAVSKLPNVLVLSLKRFDLDFNTFETVKLNSRCAFGQTLNMKPYTIEGIEAMEAAVNLETSGDPSPMDTDNSDADPLAALPDEDYEYKLVGVLVHAGVAQGGHYYSFIRDRSPEAEEKWYRFDDEDVLVFNSAAIETECFGGKVKKETKWPNGQVHTVEQEQFANALMLFYEKVKPSAPPALGEGSEVKDDKMSEVSFADGYETFKADVQQTNSTHKLQSFLFDAECQAFLNGLLGICRQSVSESNLAETNVWRRALLQTVMAYFLDIFLYSADRPGLNDWANSFCEILSLDKEASLEFVRTLAKRTAEVSGNWFRTFLIECPDKASREAAVKIFSAAATSCAYFESEMKLLEKWGDAFEEIVKEIIAIQQERKEVRECPAQLTGNWSTLENTSNVDSGEASSLGILLSSVNMLLDYLPRCWRFSAEPSTFVRSLASVRTNEVNVFRKVLIQGTLPPRLIALAIRERAPRFFQAAFPGASCPVDVANTQIRTESSTSSHVMPIGSGQVVSNDMKNSRGPGHLDYLVLLEALASLAGIPGILHVPLYYEVEDSGHGLDRVCLSEEAINALTIVFNESCATGAPGMGQREIDNYLRKSGVDASSVSPQKIADLMTKYPTVAPPAGAQAREPSYLSVEGFLAYYKDVIQSNEGKVQLDLHAFGFRPDLSRRSHNARVFVINERENERKPAESVGVDIAESLEGPIDLGTLANHAIVSSPHLYSLAFDVSEPLGEYLVASAVYKRDPEVIIAQLLITIHRTPNDWGGNLSINTAARALAVIASVPDEHQNARIALIMLNTHPVTRNAEYGAGLLHVLRVYQRGRQTQHYGNDFHWGFERYLGVLKDLRRIYPVYQWMSENREKWSFIEREISDSRASGQYQNPQQRGDYGQREADGHLTYPVDALPVDHQSHTDSDMAGPHESEYDDEDSQCDNLENYGQRQQNNGPFQIVVENAGTADVNGTYQQDGYFEGVCKFSRVGRWKNGNYKFYIFQCNVSNNTRHWYISIVPSGGSPGTSADIDFYSASVSSDCSTVPPLKTWAKGPEGVEPCPNLRFIGREEAEENDPSWIISGDGDENLEGTQHRYV